MLVLTQLRHHEKFQAKDGSHHGQAAQAAGQDHAHRQARHVRLTQVSETVRSSVVRGGAELPQPKEAAISQEPVAITDGERGKHHSQSHTDDDEGPDEGFKEGSVRQSWGQQPLGLGNTRGSM